MHSPERHKGFTFIEVLLVATIFSVLSLAIYSTFASGLRLWDRIQGEALSQRKIILNMERLSSDLRQSPVFSKIGFEGTSSSISFPVLSGTGIYRSTYIFEEKALLRKLVGFQDILEKKEEADVKKILPDLEELKFSFGYLEQNKSEYSWKDTWDKKDGTPKIVKVELKTKDADLVKQINLPAS
ncbi:MAG: hypothetical protein A3K83_01905 [Omnitrophica WOR_2 bacterium RBG_13_44_8b]|nr:MAG: hypothetical protein A3K83_01905 [Omnitrophica WOR_2 bacterium RBG_13_44_8b]